MAEIIQSHIHIDGPTNGTRLVKVTYALSFTPEEQGKVYKLGIALYGQDAAGDEEGAQPPQLIYNFKWGGFVSWPFKVITASAGIFGPFTEPRYVNRAVLNEDPGSGPAPLQVPNSDEVFALVSLSLDKRSDNTWEMASA
jgi:hypothetical protein